MAKVKASIPRSATSYGINLLGLLAYMLSIHYLRIYQVPPFWGVIISMMVLASTIMVLEKFKMGKQHTLSSGIDFSIKQKPDLKRIGIKLFGLYATLALVAFTYWLFPAYRNNDYVQYFRMAKMILVVILAGSIPFFYIMDMFMKNPCDGHWHLGMFLLGKGRETNKLILKNHLLGWVVKAFFLPIMIPALINNTGIMMNRPFKDTIRFFPHFYDYAYNFIFSVDLAFVSLGYLLTLKMFDSHIRSVEPSIFGWLVALQCYPPFWGFSSSNFFSYDDDYYWGHMLVGNLPLYKLWGMSILILLTIYTMGSIAFGLRFSNLTHRGIITNGPYRIMKHPAYVSKNIAWWMMSVPFISTTSWQDALKHSILLLGLNFIYYLRALTEERHLSLDPTYVSYATAMNEKSIFSGLYKRIPLLRYDVKRYIEDGKIKKMWF